MFSCFVFVFSAIIVSEVTVASNNVTSTREPLKSVLISRANPHACTNYNDKGFYYPTGICYQDSSVSWTKAICVNSTLLQEVLYSDPLCKNVLVTTNTDAQLAASAGRNLECTAPRRCGIAIQSGCRISINDTAPLQNDIPAVPGVCTNSSEGWSFIADCCSNRETIRFTVFPNTSNCTQAKRVHYIQKNACQSFDLLGRGQALEYLLVKEMVCPPTSFVSGCIALASNAAKQDNAYLLPVLVGVSGLVLLCCVAFVLYKTCGYSDWKTTKNIMEMDKEVGGGVETGDVF